MIKDIQLIKNKQNGKYDWNFNGIDLETVTGEQRIANEVIHVIMLQEHELMLQLYESKGCSAHNYIPSKFDVNTKNLIEEILTKSLLEIGGVRDAKVSIFDNTYSLNVREIRVTLENGKEVQINGI